MALSDVSLKNSQATSKDIWLSDEKGLRVLVKAKTGAKYFRMKYRYNGKQKTLALGTYPETSLKQARIARDEARQLLREGKDPAQIRKNAREQILANHELREFALEWWNHQKGTWTKDHAARVWTRLEDNAFKLIGSKDLKEVRATDVIQVVRKIENRDALDVAQRVLQDIRRIFRFAVQTGRIEMSPVSDVTAEVLKSRKVTHRASLKREDLTEFLRLLDNYHCQGRLITTPSISKLAVKLSLQKM